MVGTVGSVGSGAWQVEEFTREVDGRVAGGGGRGRGVVGTVRMVRLGSGVGGGGRGGRVRVGASWGAVADSGGGGGDDMMGMVGSGAVAGAGTGEGRCGLGQGILTIAARPFGTVGLVGSGAWRVGEFMGEVDGRVVGEGAINSEAWWGRLGWCGLGQGGGDGMMGMVGSRAGAGTGGGAVQPGSKVGRGGMVGGRRVRVEASGDGWVRSEDG
nr:hypothetical protein [Tanacetum cinerariifolium]